MTDLNKRIHDIRKPLNSISMQAELIKMMTDSSESNENLNAAADKIILNAKRCSEMLQTLFEDVAIDAEKGQVNKPLE